MNPLPLAIAILATASLTGCAVEIVPATGSDAPSSASPATAFSTHEAGAAISPATSAAPSAGSSSQVDTGPIPDDAFRQYYEGRFDLITGCPGGTLVLNESLQTVKITQNCHSVTIQASSVSVVAQDVDSLVIEDGGSGSTVLTANLAQATVIGGLSTVYWDSGNPVLKITGSLCTAQPNPAKGR
jgi:hypothetical protein